MADPSRYHAAGLIFLLALIRILLRSAYDVRFRLLCLTPTRFAPSETINPRPSSVDSMGTKRLRRVLICGSIYSCCAISVSFYYWHLCLISNSS